jgi:hypothetical protein
MSDLSRFIPTPAQMEAIAAGFQRVGHAARHTADAIGYLFPAAARQQLDRWERPLPRRTAPTHFGRKRRARRARGRRIETRREMPQMVTLNLGQAYGKSRALRQQLEARVGRRSAHHAAPAAGGAGR